MKRPRPYDAVDHEPGEGHPVERMIERRFPAEDLRRSIGDATAQLTTALGDQHALWHRLEELIADHRAHREQAHFDLGYEHGLAAGRAEVLREIALTDDEARALADTIRDLAVQADLPTPLAVAALMETACALALGHPAPTTSIDRSPST